MDNYNIYQELRSSGWEKKGKIRVYPGDLKNLTPSVNNHYFFYDQGKRIRFTLDGTGQVFDYLPDSQLLTRVDRTIHSGFNFGAQRFIRNGIVYSFGGTGFWAFSQALTYYDEKTAEWELLRAKNHGPVSILNGYQGYSPKSDVFYSGGSEFYRFYESFDIDYTKEFFVFDFKINKWVLLGDINKKLPFKRLREIIWTGEYFIHFANDKLFIINPETNEVYEYHNPNQMLQGGYMNYSKGDSLYTFWHINNGPVVRFSVKDILSKSNYIGPFYSNTNSLWYYALGAITVVLILGAVWFIKKFNAKKSLTFEPLEIKLLQSLLNNNQPKTLTTHEINEILDLTNKSLENQRRIRINMINRINQKIALSYTIDEPILRLPSNDDKRIMLYRLNPDAIKYIKDKI